jgi:hypothetical protein
MSAIGSLGNGVTKLVSAHPNKANRAASADQQSVIGSALFEFRARMIWILRRFGERQTSRFDVKLITRKPFDGRPAAELAYRLAFDNQKYQALFQTVAPAGPADEPRTRTDEIRAALRHFQHANTKTLSEWTGIDEEEVRKRCNEAEDIVVSIAGGGRGKPTLWRLGQPNSEPEQLPWWNPDDKPSE